jgi:hypothetical protein
MPLESFTIDKSQVHVTARCPFCGGTYTAGFAKETGHGILLHTIPYCKRFERLTAGLERVERSGVRTAEECDAMNLNKERERFEALRAAFVAAHEAARNEAIHQSVKYGTEREARSWASRAEKARLEKLNNKRNKICFGSMKSFRGKTSCDRHTNRTR